MINMFKEEVYIERRRRLKDIVGNGIILLLGNGESRINYKDNCYPFRQDSSFLYFFGINRPGLAAIIDLEADKEILFGDDADDEEIIWSGFMPRLSDHAARCGIKDVRSLIEIKKSITSVRNRRGKIHYLPPYRFENIQLLSEWLDIPYVRVGENVSVALIKAVVELRSIKSKEEINEIEKAVNVTVEMQVKAGELAKEGVSETEIAGVLHGTAHSLGFNLSFPMIITVEGQILHNHKRGNILKSGQMLLCDCGAEGGMGYAGDLTRTFPVDAVFTQKQKEIYEIVLKAHETAIEALRPGVLFKDIHLLACERLAEGLHALGLMKGDIKEAVHLGAHALFFQCGLGHMLGLDVHDMEDLGEQFTGYTETLKQSSQFGLKSLRLGKRLEAGYVITVEPGIYFIPELIDRWKGHKKFEQFICYSEVERYMDFGGIRIEDDFEITAHGHRLLGDYLSRDTEILKKRDHKSVQNNKSNSPS